MSYNPPRMPSPAPDLISRDLPCITCGYNLRTQPTTAHCPECDTPATQTFQSYAARLAGADRRWLRKLTSARRLANPLHADPRRIRLRRQTKACFGPAPLCLRPGCLLDPRRKGTNPRPEETDQPITRWALRITAILWIVPLLLSTGPLQRVPGQRYWQDSDYWQSPAFQTLIAILTWTGIVATILLFRRLKHIARRIPSRTLLHQCNVIGSQLPIAALLLAWFDVRNFRFEPDAFQHAVLAPLPGASLPWPLALDAYRTDSFFWNYVSAWQRSLDPLFLIAAWAIIVTIANLFLAIQFLIALIRVRRADRELSTYSREVLTSQSPAKIRFPPNPYPPHPYSS